MTEPLWYNKCSDDYTLSDERLEQLAGREVFPFRVSVPTRPDRYGEMMTQMRLTNFRIAAILERLIKEILHVDGQ